MTTTRDIKAHKRSGVKELVNALASLGVNEDDIVIERMTIPYSTVNGG